MPYGDLIMLLDPSARAGRTGHRLRVKDARDLRAKARYMLGVSRDDTPSTAAILHAAAMLSTLLFDATEGEASLRVAIRGDGAHSPEETHTPATVLATLRRRSR